MASLLQESKSRRQRRRRRRRRQSKLDKTRDEPIAGHCSALMAHRRGRRRRRLESLKDLVVVVCVSWRPCWSDCGSSSRRRRRRHGQGRSRISHSAARTGRTGTPSRAEQPPARAVNMQGRNFGRRHQSSASPVIVDDAGHRRLRLTCEPKPTKVNCTAKSQPLPASSVGRHTDQTDMRSKLA